MLLKIVFLLTASAVFGLSLKTDQDELLLLYQQVDGEIKVAQHEVQIQIRAKLVPLQYYINEVTTYVFGNLSKSAEPYWSAIASLEEAAAANGQDISSCVNAGNGELYALNETFVSGPENELNACRVKGQEIILNSSTLSYGTISELLSLELEVMACADSVCAEELKAALIEFHGRALETLQTAEDTSATYVLEELPQKLALIKFDSSTYIQKLNLILDSVTLCVYKL